MFGLFDVFKKTELLNASFALLITKDYKSKENKIEEQKRIKNLKIIEKEKEKLIVEIADEIFRRSQRGVSSFKLIIKHYHKLATIIPELNAYKQFYVFRTDCDDHELTIDLREHVAKTLKKKDYYVSFGGDNDIPYIYISWNDYN